MCTGAAPHMTTGGMAHGRIPVIQNFLLFFLHQGFPGGFHSPLHGTFVVAGVGGLRRFGGLLPGWDELQCCGGGVSPRRQLGGYRSTRLRSYYRIVLGGEPLSLRSQTAVHRRGGWRQLWTLAAVAVAAGCGGARPGRRGGRRRWRRGRLRAVRPHGGVGRGTVRRRRAHRKRIREPARHGAAFNSLT